MGETIKEMLKKIDQDEDVKSSFFVPIAKVLLELKQIKHHKQDCVRMSLIVPIEIGKTIPEIINSDWRLALFGVKHKKTKGGK